MLLYSTFSSHSHQLERMQLITTEFSEALERRVKMRRTQNRGTACTNWSAIPLKGPILPVLYRGEVKKGKVVQAANVKLD
jgi:hypothetical protein